MTKGLYSPVWFVLTCMVASARRHAPLPVDTMLDYQYTFVTGLHHSGTTLLDIIVCQHANVSCILGSLAPQNEGQHLQRVYKTARAFGGPLQFGFDPDNHMTENDKHFEKFNVGQRLFAAWSRFWNASASMFLEKSPRHVTMMRFIQHAFGKERTRFLVAMRHPLGATHFNWGKHLGKGARGIDRMDCGRTSVKHWLRIHDYVQKDLPHLKNVRIVQFEDLVGLSKPLTQVAVDKIFNFLGFDDSVRLEFEQQKDTSFIDGDHQVDYHRNVDIKESGGPPLLSRRHLLEYHGDWNHVTVRFGDVNSWADQWLSKMDMNSTVCQKVIADYEDRLLKFGYSLKNLKFLSKPQAFAPWYLDLDKAHAVYLGS